MDRDDFRFTGAVGERVTLRLEPNRQAGHLGTTATLSVRTPEGTVLVSHTGAPPLEVTLSLPATGAYDAVVAEPLEKGVDIYRGAYRLHLIHDPGRIASPPANVLTVPALLPQRNVEP